jgi:hypothetical protein
LYGFDISQLPNPGYANGNANESVRIESLHSDGTKSIYQQPQSAAIWGLFLPLTQTLPAGFATGNADVGSKTFSQRRN